MVSFKKHLSLGVVDTAAIALITTGVGLINQGNYIVGGVLVTFGWVLLVVSKYVSGISS